MTVTNTTDPTPSVKTTTLTDGVRITAADYDSAAQTLTVSAQSSDEAVPPTLTVSGPGLTGAAPGVLAVVAPPAVITVASSHGGTSTETVTGIG